MLILGLVCFLTFFAGLGRGAIGDSDEAFYAEASREMVASGDWLTPYYNYELRFQKPILFYWLVSIAYKAAGVGEAAARFPAALAGFGLAIITYLVGRRWFDAGTGFFFHGSTPSEKAITLKYARGSSVFRDSVISDLQISSLFDPRSGRPRARWSSADGTNRSCMEPDVSSTNAMRSPNSSMPK